MKIGRLIAKSAIIVCAPVALVTLAVTVPAVLDAWRIAKIGAILNAPNVIGVGVPVPKDFETLQESKK